MTTFGIIVIVVVVIGLIVWASTPSKSPTVVVVTPKTKEGFKTDAETPHSKVEPKVAVVSKAPVTKKAMPMKKAVRKITKKTK